MKHNIKVKRLDGFTEGQKRQYLPFQVNWVCDECGKTQMRNYLDDYLMYPKIPSVNKKFYLYCNNCDHDSGPFTLRLDISMEIFED